VAARLIIPSRIRGSVRVARRPPRDGFCAAVARDAAEARG